MHELAGEVDQRLAAYPQHFEVAVMGCAVNGPGEAGNADFGIAGGRDAGFIYAHGEVLRKVPQEQLVDELFREIDAWIARGMPRPERGRGHARDRRRGRVIGRLVKLVHAAARDRAARRAAPGRGDARARLFRRFAQRREAGRWHHVDPPDE